MPATLSYPGVYIEEIPSGVRTITGVATSITAFIGRAKRGPVDEPITINGYPDFERIFGGLWQESRLGFAVRDFFLNGGGQAVVVRVFHPTFGPGEQGKAKTAAEAVAKEANDAAGSDLTAKLDDAKVTDIQKKADDKAKEFDSESDPEKKAAQAVLATVVLVAKKDAKVGDVKNAIDAAVKNAAPVTQATLTIGTTNQLKLEAAFEGVWGNDLRARVDHERPKELPESYKAFGLALDDLFNLIVRDMKTGNSEVYRNLTVKSGPRTIDKVLENESKLVRVTQMPNDVPDASDPSDISDADKKIVPFSNEDVAVNKRSVGVTDRASDGSNLAQDDFTGDGKEADSKGLYALERLFARDGLFNLLCIPPYKFDDPSGDVDTDLWAKAAAYCEKRRAMLIIDPPSSWRSKTDARNNFVGGDNEFPGIRSKNAALFFPRLIQPNSLRDNQMEDFVPCGAVAGIFSRTDVQRGVWKAPAGIEATLMSVPKLSVPMTDEENGELNPLGINCLRSFPATGRIIWGSRTLRGADQLADEWKYIPVRRTALFLEESLFRGLKWVVFEPNDEPLWAQIRLNVGAFMNNLFRQGAFQGRTAREAYLVKCDSETTTQNDINLGVVNVVVGFAPLKPAEFVVIKIQQLAGQIQV
ncbi:phage tail sheath C-terminal domain-containing protein [Methylosarcina fibrata]|uniref:phage tail sheath C-terminal domain-containing protein n=1 Tax=Methylosarcina fibrata TaxID=105972 RepID=UPI000372879D|nr:phage tail sheath C-terminal domain-containing protein [Methylosarcina fibrata]